MLYRTYLPAKIIEDMLEAELAESETTIYSAPHYNCREVGFMLYRGGWEPYSTYIYVCEARGSDQIMVTTSTNMGWDMIKEEEYKAARYFEPGDYKGALEHILAELRILDPTL